MRLDIRTKDPKRVTTGTHRAPRVEVIQESLDVHLVHNRRKLRTCRVHDRVHHLRVARLNCVVRESRTRSVWPEQLWVLFLRLVEAARVGVVWRESEIGELLQEFPTQAIT